MVSPGARPKAAAPATPALLASSGAPLTPAASVAVHNRSSGAAAKGNSSAADRKPANEGGGGGGGGDARSARSGSARSATSHRQAQKEHPAIQRVGGVSKSKSGGGGGGGGNKSRRARSRANDAPPAPGLLSPIIARISFMSVQTQSVEQAAAAAPAGSKGGGAVATAAANGARRTTSVHTSGSGDASGLQSSSAAASGAGSIPTRKPGAVLAGGGDGDGGGGKVAPAGGRAAMPAAAAAAMTPLPRRKKAGKLRRAWNRFKQMATCSNVATFDPPLHGVALVTGETVADVSREAALEAAEAEAGGVTARGGGGAAAAGADEVIGSGGTAGGETATSVLPAREDSAGAASDRSRHDHTGYLTTPAQWQRGAPATNGLYGSEQFGDDPSSPSRHGGVLRGGGADGGSNRAMEGGAGGGGSVGRTPAPAPRLLPASGGSGGFASLDRVFIRGRESVNSVRTSGDAEEDWHDARSVASTFSISSCFGSGHLLPPHGQSSPAGAAEYDDAPAGAGGAHPFHPHQRSGDGGPGPYVAATAAAAKAAADVMSMQIREAQKCGKAAPPPPQQQQQQQQQAQVAGQLVPATPATPPPATRRVTPPAPDWSPDNTNLTGQFSTPVLAAPHRTGSASSSAVSGSRIAAAIDAAVAANAAAAVSAARSVTPSSPLPAATPRGALTAAPAEAAVVKALPAGLLERERPPWVPEKPIPGLDPDTLFVPSPKATGIAGYWAKVPELSAPLPMPIDVALGCNRLARTAHESIRGILLRETDTDIVLKARLTLPLGVKMTHEERYHKDHSTHTMLLRRDVKPGTSVTRMFCLANGDVLLVCESFDMSGTVTHVGYELVHLLDNGERIQCRQWVVIAKNGLMVEQYFVGKRAPIPGR